MCDVSKRYLSTNYIARWRYVFWSWTTGFFLFIMWAMLGPVSQVRNRITASDTW